MENIRAKIIVTVVAVILLAYILGQPPAGKKAISVATIGPNGTFSATPQILDAPQTLTIYTYDGITSDWGLGPKIFPEFEKECGCKVKTVAKGDVGAFVSQLIFEKGSPKADIALGIDNTFMPRVIDADILEPYAPKNIGEIEKSLVNPDMRFIPFDYGYLAFEYDSEKILSPPKSLEDLTKPEFAKKIIIEDARTSSPGKVFLYWVASEYGGVTSDYLSRLKPNLLTITPGWTEAYNLFLLGEAPIVLTYSTSPAYHIINENATKFKAAIFEKMYRQIEYVSVVKGTKNLKLAHQFIEFMVSRKAQEQIPLGNFMYPVRADVVLPDAFRQTPFPASTYPEISNGDKWLKIWEQTFSS